MCVCEREERESESVCVCRGLRAGKESSRYLVWLGDEELGETLNATSSYALSKNIPSHTHTELD